MLKNILITIGSRATQTALAGIILILSARWLGVEIRAEISVFVSSIAISGFLAQGIGGPSLIYLMPVSPFHLLTVISLVSAIVLSVLGGFLLFSIGFAGIDNLWAFIASVTLFNVHAVARMILFSKQKIQTENFAGLVLMSSQFLLLLFGCLVWKMEGSLPYVWAVIGSSTLAIFYTIPALFKLWKSELPLHGRLDIIKPLLKTALSKGLTVQAGNLLYLLTTRILFYTMEYRHEMKALGIFSVSVAAMEAIQVFSGSLASNVMSKVSNEDNKSSNLKVTQTLIQFSFLTHALVFICILIVPDSFFTALLGKGFVGIQALLIRLAPGYLILGPATIALHYFSGKGNFKVNFWAVLLGVISTLTLGNFLLTHFGSFGAAYSIVISLGILGVVGFWAFYKEWEDGFPSPIPDRKFWSQIMKYVRNSRTVS